MNTRSETLEARVRQRLDSLTKPKGSLGRLEEIAVRFALVRGEEMPSPARKTMYIFCADHGITDENVTPYPRAVTRQMAQNFVDGGAAINVLCRCVGTLSRPCLRGHSHPLTLALDGPNSP